MGLLKWGDIEASTFIAIVVECVVSGGLRTLSRDSVEYLDKYL